MLPERMAEEGSRKCLGMLLAGLFLLLATVFTALAPGVKNAAFPLISGMQKNDMFMKSASVQEAESRNSDGGHEDSSPRATSVQPLGRNLMEPTRLSPLPSVSNLLLQLSWEHFISTLSPFLLKSLQQFSNCRQKGSIHCTYGRKCFGRKMKGAVPI